jgi:hypothetical protein
MIKELLLAAIMMVESSGDPEAVGDNGASVGAYQIQQADITDVNRVYGTSYVTADRLSPEKSREICIKYLTYWGGRYEYNSGQKATDEVLARIWNGGPYGFRKAATERYWAKVALRMERMAR